MKILVICQHYWPEPYYLADVCEELVRRGHEVHVVTDVPNYPMGTIYPEYRHGKQRNQVRNGVRITRTFTIGRRHNILFRFLNYYSYAISSTRCVKRFSEAYDIVFTNQSSPVMMVRAAMAYAAKWGKKAVLYCMDLWPASLAAGGIKERSLIYRYYRKVSEKLYKKADSILITSKMFREYLETNFDIQDDRIHYFPQYADNCFELSNSAAKKAKDTVDFMFAGNIGAAQSLDTVIRTADLMRNDSWLRWHIVGDGSELGHLKKLVHEMGLDGTVVFHGRKPAEEMPKYYAMADAMLVTLTKDPFISMTLPGKVQTYMAAGKPIIASADGEIPLVLREAECGYCAPAEDPEGLAKAVACFLERGEWGELGKNARKYYQSHFTRERFMNSLEQVLREHATVPNER